MPNYVEIIEQIYSKYNPAISKPKASNNNFSFDRNIDVSDAQKYLQKIDADVYDNWVKVAFALKDKFGEDGFCFYHSWSMSSKKYVSEAECRKKWGSAKGKDNNIKFGTLKFLADNSNIKEIVNITEWNASKYSGEVPKTNWLVEGIFPKGVPILLAGYGGIGKSYLSLALAVSVATYGKDTGFNTSSFLCDKVTSGGTAVYFSAEDNKDEIHKRLLEIDPERKVQACADKLRVIPLSDAGGAFAIIRKNGQGFLESTEEFKNILEQLKAIDDLALVIFDPLQVFAQAEIDRDNNAAQFFCNQMRLLAAETGATVLISHHMRKPDQNNPISNLEMAREAVRGASGLVDGVRGVMCLWEYKKAVYAGMAKSNYGAKKITYELKRLDNGILVCDSENTEANKKIVLDIIKKCADKNPLMPTGKKSLFERKKEFGAPVENWTKKRCNDIVSILLEEGNATKKHTGALFPFSGFRTTMDFENDLTD
jgi:hypothetical protein